MRVIPEKVVSERVEFYWTFQWRDRKKGSGGFSFPVTADGDPLPDWCPEALENYKKCRSGEYDVADKGIRSRNMQCVEPRHGICSCSEKVFLTRFTNTCDKCGKDYNSSGQLLAPREQWCEETGEHWSEIINAGKDDLDRDDLY